MPEDFQYFENVLNSGKEALFNHKTKQLWITKPHSSSCGRGIKLVTEAYQINRNAELIAQKYIMNPHLIDGRKYDLRIYVVATSFSPLIVYRFDDGLTRFSTKKYVFLRVIFLSFFSVFLWEH